MFALQGYLWKRWAHYKEIIIYNIYVMMILNYECIFMFPEIGKD
jgi:hypothetical protein